METLKICANPCSVKELLRKDLEYRKEAGLPLYKSPYKPKFPYHDEDGFACCVYCGGVINVPTRDGRRQLTKCDTCRKWFKGVKKFLNIEYTCPECE